MFVIKPVEGKGLGVFATRPIKKGEKILSERPLFTQSRPLSAATIAQSLAPKTADEKRQYLALTNCHRGTTNPRLRNPLVGIFATNALPCGFHSALEGHRATSGGIFLQGSRFNNSCTPNVNNFWDASHGEILFHAVRNIAEGKELCILYTEMFESRRIRRLLLEEKFKFQCACAACAMEGNAQRGSDRRRIALGALYTEIADCQEPVRGVSMVMQALELLDGEGLEAYGAGFAYDAYNFCMAASDVRHAAEWLRKWRTMGRVLYGQAEADKNYAERCGVIRNPQSHRLYGTCSRMVLAGPDDPCLFGMFAYYYTE